MMNHVKIAIGSLDVGEKLKNNERRLTDLVVGKLGMLQKRSLTNLIKLMLLSLLLKLLQKNLKELKMMKIREVTKSLNV